MSYHKLDRYQGRDGDSEYLRLTRQIPNNIVNISRNTKQLQKIVKVIGTPKESQQSMGQIRHIVRDTNSLIKMTKQMVSDIGELDGGGAMDDRNRRQQQRKFNQDLVATARAFQTVADDALEREEECLARERAESLRQQRGSSSGHGGYGGYDDRDDMDMADEQRRQQGMMVAQDVNVRTAFIQEREQGIKELHGQMEQVHEIFQDVAVMVQDQGEVLENIEANMQVTYDRVDRGVGELTHASRYQKSARNKAMCLLVIVVIVAGILAAILVPTLKKK